MTFVPGPTLVAIWLLGSTALAFWLAALTLGPRHGGDNLDRFAPLLPRTAVAFALINLAALAALAVLS